MAANISPGRSKPQASGGLTRNLNNATTSRQTVFGHLRQLPPR